MGFRKDELIPLKNEYSPKIYKLYRGLHGVRPIHHSRVDVEIAIDRLLLCGVHPQYMLKLAEIGFYLALPYLSSLFLTRIYVVEDSWTPFNLSILKLPEFTVDAVIGADLSKWR